MMRLNKIITLTFFYLFLGCSQTVAWGQTINGKIIDDKQLPIDGATIILQTMDSTYIGASISNADGIFVFKSQQEEYRLIIQHLLYETKQMTGKGNDAGIIQLQPKDYALDEVIIKAERPFVKVENGLLGYNLAVLTQNQLVNNAYEALTKIPGVQEDRGILTLAGAGKLTVILNGKPTTMDAGQLETILRNTPVNRVEKAEVMYSAPPEYHVRGAVINLVLKHANDYSFQGEISADYKNQYFNDGGMNGNFRLSTPKMAFDVMYGANNVKKIEYIDLDSKHTLKDEPHHIIQNEQLRSKYWKHDLRVAFEYNFNNKNNINVAYTAVIPIFKARLIIAAPTPVDINTSAIAYAIIKINRAITISLTFESAASKISLNFLFSVITAANAAATVAIGAAISASNPPIISPASITTGINLITSNICPPVF